MRGDGDAVEVLGIAKLRRMWGTAILAGELCPARRAAAAEAERIQRDVDRKSIARQRAVKPASAMSEGAMPKKGRSDARAAVKSERDFYKKRAKAERLTRRCEERGQKPGASGKAERGAAENAARHE